MKLGARDAAAYFARPDPDRTGLLIYGGDAMRVALQAAGGDRRADRPRGRGGDAADPHPGSDLRKDPALLLDAVKAQGFFPGPRVAFVEEATDALSETVAAALADWQRGDAQIVVTAGAAQGHARRCASSSSATRSLCRRHL